MDGERKRQGTPYNQHDLMMMMMMIYKKSKVGDLSRRRPEGSLFNNYYTKV